MNSKSGRDEHSSSERSQLMIDFLEVQEQMREYRTGLQSTLDQDHEAAEIPHYNQLTQMLSHFAQLTEHALQRSQEQIQTIEELSLMKAEFEQQTLASTSQIHSLEAELKNFEKRISSLQTEVNQYEQDYKECAEELRNANEAIRNYQELNDDLCIKIERLERDEQAIKQEDNAQSVKLAESFRNLAVFQKKVLDAEQQEREHKKELQRVTAINEEWEAKTKDIWLEIQQSELFQEKKDYERTVRMNDMAALMQEQQEQILALEVKLQQQESRERLMTQGAAGAVLAEPGRGGLGSLGEDGGRPQGAGGYAEKLRDARPSQQSESGATGEMQVKDEDDELDGQLEIAQGQSPSSAAKAQRDDQYPEVLVEEEADNPNDFEGLEDEFQGLGGAAAGGDVIVMDMMDLPEGDLPGGARSMPGSFLEPGAEEDYDIDNQQEYDIDNPLVSAEQEYRSNSDQMSANEDIDVTLDKQPFSAESGKGKTTSKQPQEEGQWNTGTPSGIIKGTELPKVPIEEGPLTAHAGAVSESPVQGMRRDPEEEYFMLAILAQKMIHTETEEAEYIYEINSQKLFQQVKALKIPFHRWYQWLETRFTQLKQVHEKEQAAKSQAASSANKTQEASTNSSSAPKSESRTALEYRSSPNAEGYEVLSVKKDDGGLAGAENKNTGAFGIFDKIYNYLNRQSKEEKEEQERKQRESDRRLLLGGGSHGLGLKKNPYSSQQLQQTSYMSPNSVEILKKYQNLTDIQKKNMPFYPNYQHIGQASTSASAAGTHSRGNSKSHLGMPGSAMPILSTKSEEILQRGQPFKMSRGMAPTSQLGGTQDPSANTKDVQSGKPSNPALQPTVPSADPQTDTRDAAKAQQQ